MGSFITQSNEPEFDTGIVHLIVQHILYASESCISIDYFTVR